MKKTFRLCALFVTVFWNRFEHTLDNPFPRFLLFAPLPLIAPLGGSPNSQHMSGHAVDIELAGVDNFSLARWIMENLVFDQLVLEFYVSGQPSSGWVHVSFLDEKEKGLDGKEQNRNQVLTRNADQYCTGLVP